MQDMVVRPAEATDLEAILAIYNEGIVDRIATLEEEPKDQDYIEAWFSVHQQRYRVLVADMAGDGVVGWVSLNPYSSRCAYAGVADLSVYVGRRWRGRGVGSALLKAIEPVAQAQGFYKIVLFTFPFNEAGQRLYRKQGYRTVGTFFQQGILDGQFVDVMAMEKLLSKD
ncbi:MAG: GNAT family N-acetyltransferase [Sulfobacillus acidophilus]|uniref:GNAT family N-acetyltransferase n=1 Tax=Sulfobacillus acidophilus TaxID=53633 RepID=A0A2T2WEH6_9FIRM|nr:MAG: GNAT family N-acetyltransferase [Sulfobacillus acidophilus]